jgi:hypothetical protein
MAAVSKGVRQDRGTVVAAVDPALDVDEAVERRHGAHRARHDDHRGERNRPCGASGVLDQQAPDQKPEADDRDRGPNPGQQRAIVGEVVSHRCDRPLPRLVHRLPRWASVG